MSPVTLHTWCVAPPNDKVLSSVTLHTWCVEPPIDKVYHKVSKLPQHRVSYILRYEVKSTRWSLK